MKIPHGMTENEVLEIIQKISRKIAKKYSYSYHVYADILQDAFIEAVSALEQYDASLPIENYLTICLRNHFLNQRRKYVERAESPCNRCALYIMSSCMAFRTREQCERYGRWTRRNISKRLLANGVLKGTDENGESLGLFEREYTHRAYEGVDNQEIIDQIEAKIPFNMRKLYLRWKSGVKISKADEHTIRNLLVEIAGEINGGA